MGGQQTYVNTVLNQSEGSSESVTAIVSGPTQNPDWTATFADSFQHSNGLSSQTLACGLHQI
jgi:hypothetical protein